MCKKMTECNGREKCNWWILLGEIREEFEMVLLHDGGSGAHNRRSYKNRVIELIDMFTHSAYKVCKEHWDGKR